MKTTDNDQLPVNIGFVSFGDGTAKCLHCGAAASEGHRMRHARNCEYAKFLRHKRAPEWSTKIENFLSRRNYQLISVNTAASLVLVAAMRMHSTASWSTIIAWMLVMAVATAIADVLWYAIASARRRGLI